MPSTQADTGPGMETASRGFRIELPKTKLGKWSMWLAVVFIVMFVINTVLVGAMGQSNDAVLNEFRRTYLPFYGISMFLVGFVAGVVGLIAIWKKGERSFITLITLVPALFVIFFLVGEFASPH